MAFARNCGVCGAVYIGEHCPTCADTSRRKTEPQPLRPGSRIKGFELLALLGRGGMAVVYKARQTSLDRVVALKLLPPERSASSDFQTRFEREAKALAALQHPNIVTVYDFGEEAGQYFFAMELVEGADLRSAGRPEPGRAVEIAISILDALEFAHSKGIVHRDIKPENVLLDGRGRVRIADFGLARLLGADENLRLTQSDATLGTPRYMSPEQMAGAADADARSDLYSLGVMIYELLTGALPVGRFPSPSSQSKVPPSWDPVILKALEMDPNRRYQTAAEFKAALAGLRLGATPAPARRPWWVAAAVLVPLVVLIAWRPWKKAASPAPAPSGTAVAKLDPRKITFAQSETPINSEYASVVYGIPRIAYSTEMAEGPGPLQGYLAFSQFKGVSTLRYGYLAAWHRASVLVLDTDAAESLDQQLEKLLPQDQRWSCREGTVVVLIRGDPDAVRELAEVAKQRIASARR